MLYTLSPQPSPIPAEAGMGEGTRVRGGLLARFHSHAVGFGVKLVANHAIVDFRDCFSWD